MQGGEAGIEGRRQFGSTPSQFSQHFHHTILAFTYIHTCSALRFTSVILGFLGVLDPLAPLTSLPSSSSLTFLVVFGLPRSFWRPFIFLAPLAPSSSLFTSFSSLVPPPNLPFRLRTRYIHPMQHLKIDASLLRRAREPDGAGLILFYNLLYADRGWVLPDHLAPVCQALADVRIKKLMLILGPGNGKSQLLSTTFPIWALGHDPSLTILGISGAENLMHGFIQGAMELIEYSPVYKAIFPAVRPDKNAGWSTQRGIFVTGRSPGIPDASFFGAGIGSKALAGKHAKLIILDDVHTDGNSQTPEQCEGVRRLYYNTILGRADPMGARFILAGRRWHENDLYGHLMQTEEWVTMILPAFRDGVKELYFDVLVPDGLKCVFTDN